MDIIQDNIVNFTANKRRRGTNNSMERFLSSDVPTVQCRQFWTYLGSNGSQHTVACPTPSIPSKYREEEDNISPMNITARSKVQTDTTGPGNQPSDYEPSKKWTISSVICFTWISLMVIAEVPKLWPCATNEVYHALAWIPDQPVSASSRWWLFTHIFLVNIHMFTFYMYAYLRVKGKDNQKWGEICTTTNQIIAVTVFCNLTSSTVKTPIEAFKFNTPPLILFVVLWRCIYDDYFLLSFYQYIPKIDTLKSYVYGVSKVDRYSRRIVSINGLSNFLFYLYWTFISLASVIEYVELYRYYIVGAPKPWI